MDQSSAGLVRLSAARHGPQPMPAPIASPDSFAGVMALIALIGDAGAAKKRLTELMDAQKAAAAKIEEAATAEQKLAGVDAELKAARKANEAAMSHDRELQQTELARKFAEMVNREQQIERREQEAGRIHAEASKLRDEWMEKTAKLKAALGTAA